jgi:hypothetical protein
VLYDSAGVIFPRVNIEPEELDTIIFPAESSSISCGCSNVEIVTDVPYVHAPPPEEELDDVLLEDDVLDELVLEEELEEEELPPPRAMRFGR